MLGLGDYAASPAIACVLSAYVVGIWYWRIYTSYYDISYVL